MSLPCTRLLAPLVVGTLLAAAPPPPYDRRGEDPAERPAHATACGTESGPGGPATATRIDPADSHHAYTGNGYLGTRVPPTGAGYAESGAATGWPLFTPRYDGAFVAGLYAHEPETTADRQVLAALPGWTALSLRVGDETFGDGEGGRISRYRQSLLAHCAVVVTSLRWTTSEGRVTDLTYEVLTDRSDPHTGAVRLRLTPRWSGEAAVTGDLDWRGARRITRTGEARTRDGAVATFRTRGTETTGALASVLRSSPRDAKAGRDARDGSDGKDSSDGKDGRDSRDGSVAGGAFAVRADRTYTVEKYVGVDTALTSPDPRAAALAAARRAAARGWQRVFAANADAWAPLWEGEVEVAGAGREQAELRAWLRAARYGLLTATRPGAADSIAPTGLSSDNYAGLVFWDAEVFLYPGLLATRPELARSVVEYRYRTRAAAARNAAKLGFKGLFYPWTSGGEGRLWSECQSWNPPHCVTQIHLQSDIALAVWQYYLATGDREWLRERGWPLLRGIAEFWASRVSADADGGYSVKEVAGPDEYSNGVTDGVFTNAGAATVLRHAARAAALVGEEAPAAWTRIADRLRIPYDPRRKVYLQYAGYDGARIKQADAVLLTYPLEWPMPEGAAAATLDYYAERTDPDGPAMTDAIHAIDAAAIGEPGCSAYTYLQRSVRPFTRGPFALFSEARGDKAGADDPLSGSPAQDFLTGQGGFLQVFTHGLTGLRLREDGVRLDPTLPPQLARGVTLRGLRWQGRTYEVALGARETTVRLTSGAPFTVHTPGGARTLTGTLTLPTRRPDLAPTPDVARCRPASATSEEPGQYAAAAVDGSPATAWVPAEATAALTVDLGRTARVGSVTPRWTRTRPAAYEIETSTSTAADAARWQPLKPGAEARLVRVTLRAPAGQRRAGITGLTVREEEGPGSAGRRTPGQSW
ncbi:glycosyl hydrolase family 65 protein [Streptomyces corynorhini]|uniref:Haloacid dehalogenase n=1 Tax=Streptomyces corynorhini TaxID=2282652 RepID=A0A370BBN8_9ACTN|nr:glycosyl hydrolase family 65 protein [Streptomyces corynorhini]RDG39210.1 haloacid dehalogenase [Streptomyces corynorhini]